jgi:hypothetical protein
MPTAKLTLVEGVTTVSLPEGAGPRIKEIADELGVEPVDLLAFVVARSTQGAWAEMRLEATGQIPPRAETSVEWPSQTVLAAAGWDC